MAATAITEANSSSDNTMGATEKFGGANTTASKSKQGEGLRQYYEQHIQELQLLTRQRNNDLQRLEAQRNELNCRG